MRHSSTLISNFYSMYCRHCGNKLESGTKFCSSCGSKFNGESALHDRDNVVASNEKWSVSRLWHGRIGRWHYFAGSMLPTLGIFILVSVWGVVRLLQSTFTVSGGAETVGTLGLMGTLINAIIGLLITLLIIAFFLVHIPLAIRRCHDLGYTGWLSLLAYIPYLGFIAALFFIFMKGEEVSNKYGNPPADRKFLADVFNY